MCRQETLCILNTCLASPSRSVNTHQGRPDDINQVSEAPVQLLYGSGCTAAVWITCKPSLAKTALRPTAPATR